MDFHKQWIEQCEAAEKIEADFGIEKALGYLIGEKLMTHLEIAEKNPLFEQEILPFCAKIKELFEQWRIAKYLNDVKRTGPFGHTMSDDEYEDVGQQMEEYNVVRAAQNVLRIEKIKKLLVE
jgi:hypothetical protein